MLNRIAIGIGSLAICLTWAAPLAASDEFEEFVQPVLLDTCAACHDATDPSGDVDLESVSELARLRESPELIQAIIKVVSANDMPPTGEPPLAEIEREQFLSAMKGILESVASDSGPIRVPMRRLNRFQYNYAVKDLLQLNADVFPLPEKLMTRHSDYLHNGSDVMPVDVQAKSYSLQPQPGFREVRAFPKDLRAAHGFDNQANQLTLSPLLLDAFLRLSVSIVDSPDFNEQSVGIWSEFFEAPSGSADLEAEARNRLQPFLTLAFRGPVDDETLDRYVDYVVVKHKEGLPFTECMKKVTSAVLSSPLFLYRASEAEQESQFALASSLSFFLWSSGPDAALLELAQSGRLKDAETLQHTIDRMLADPKVERFLDTFPAQWMQLENTLAATPDPGRYRLYSIDKDHPASLQMILEPLLLFDAVYVENRSVVDLIAPDFAYQSEFLRTWYTSDLIPPPVDVERVVSENKRNETMRSELQTNIEALETRLAALRDPIKERLLLAKREDAGNAEPVDLKPYAAWEFENDLKDSIGSLHLNAHGEVEFENGKVILEGDYLLSEKLPFDLQAKTLEVWCEVHNLDQAGGGVMGIQGPGDFFDTIVIGERQPRHWISGSNGFSRTKDFPESYPEENAKEMLHLVMVYLEDGTTTLYRNGESYGKPYQNGSATFPKDQTSVIFGLRHLPPGGNKFLNVSIDKAMLYDRALTAEEVEASSRGNSFYVTETELVEAMTEDQRAQHEDLNRRISDLKVELSEVPPSQDPAQLQREATQRFDNNIREQLRSQSFSRVDVTDPRYGGIVTNAAMLSMTSGPTRTHPIARGAWVVEVVFNDPPPPPPNDVPALDEDNAPKDLTIREMFAAHRANPDCAACHSRLDPLGFALENFDITGRWRDNYENGREVDSSGTMMRKYEFESIVEFKESLVLENERFAKAFTGHLLRYALSRELGPFDSLTIDKIVAKTEDENYRIKDLIREVILNTSLKD